ncbi:hypothetical protein SL003B_3044 [Polymorphum gilvum SL003B-26A1]|uniref:DUF1800 domain-containing protein n=2 Tax=Polymorphum TaxID=991903 RepID=F2IW82_POLGS|nr:hypothetical protein SL003B_3044 [Polymorphum gilvum SL003B-26A1]
MDAVVATRRFGYGAQPGEIAARATDPRASVLAELEHPDAALLDDADLPDRSAVMRRFFDYRDERKAFRASTQLKGAERGEAEREQLGPNPLQEIYRAEVLARIRRATATARPLLERLVAFWSNHLCIAANAGQVVRLLAGQFEREVIRPHVLGRFEDMLVAAMRHPAMLSYLDNDRSVGPNSRAGQRTGKSLNENLAREILELHTLGVDGGYSQADVTDFARVLTGWGFEGAKGDRPGAFLFRPARHEPGAPTVLGRVYGQAGEAKGLAVLRDLAHHPSTARFLSVKLVRHFLGRVPAGDLVDRLAGVYLGSGGDLGALTRALVAAPELWRPERPVLTAPYDFLVATLRASGAVPKDRQILRMLEVFGQPTWVPPSPAGWPDEAEAWLAPGALLERLDWAEMMAGIVDLPDDMDAYGRDILGAAYDPDTRLALRRAESRRQAFVMLVMSPGFQRR